METLIDNLPRILTGFRDTLYLVAAFGVTEATYQLDSLVRDHPDALYALCFGIAAGYIAIVFAISGAAHQLERRLVVIR